MNILIITVINFTAALLQATTGFGYAMVAMTLMPLFLPFKSCSAVCAICAVVIAVHMVLSLRKHINVKKIILPVVFCMLSTNIGVYMLMTLNERTLKGILAGLIVLVTIIFVVSNKKKIVIKKNIRNDIIFGSLTGLATGMFNIIGPFFTVYYFSSSENNLEFKANLECSFLVAGMYSVLLHVKVGNINMKIMPYLVASGISVLIAGFLGLPLYKKLNSDKLKKIIYIVLPITALILLLR